MPKGVEHSGNPLIQAIRFLTVVRVADLCGVTPPTVYAWERKGRLPHSELDGKTQYAERIAAELRVLYRIGAPAFSVDDLLASTRAAWKKKPWRKTGGTRR